MVKTNQAEKLKSISLKNLIFGAIFINICMIILFDISIYRIAWTPERGLIFISVMHLLINGIFALAYFLLRVLDKSVEKQFSRVVQESTEG